MKQIDKGMCPNCKNRPGNTKKMVGLSIIHYHQLMWLIGTTDRDKLLSYYRSFMWHDLVSYCGNTLLDNVTSTFTIQNLCSAKALEWFQHQYLPAQI